MAKLKSMLQWILWKLAASILIGCIFFVVTSAPLFASIVCAGIVFFCFVITNLLDGPNVH